MHKPEPIYKIVVPSSSILTSFIFRYVKLPYIHIKSTIVYFIKYWTIIYKLTKKNIPHDKRMKIVYRFIQYTKYIGKKRERKARLDVYEMIIKISELTRIPQHEIRDLISRTHKLDI